MSQSKETGIRGYTDWSHSPGKQKSQEAQIGVTVHGQQR